MTQIDDAWFMLSDEERMFCDVLARFCAERVAPLARETDEAASFVHAQLAGLGETGMMGANLPEAYGGSGVSAAGLLRAVSIVSAACGSTGSALTAHYLATELDPARRDGGSAGGTPPAARLGKALAAFALTEPAPAPTRPT